MAETIAKTTPDIRDSAAFFIPRFSIDPNNALSPVHTSNNVEATFDFVEKNRSICGIRGCCYDTVSGVDGALNINRANQSELSTNLRSSASLIQCRCMRTKVKYHLSADLH